MVVTPTNLGKERLMKDFDSVVDQTQHLFGRDAARATDSFVQKNPWRAVGFVVAAAAIGGLVAGLLVARR